jgi:hypothetical protein
MAIPNEAQPRLVAPYVPFKSFLTALDNLRHGPPVILDRTVWPTFSGGLAGQMLAAFRFLGFITEDYEVTDLLSRAIDPDQRKEALARAMRASFEDIFALDLSRATPKQLSDVLSEQYNVSGSTHKKALTFFLHAAKFTDVALAPAISRKTRSSGPRKRRQPNGGAITPEATVAGSEIKIAQPKSQTGSSKTIKLLGGGSATLSFDVDVWSMTPADQEFVFGMIRRMNEYEAKRAQPDSAQTETPEVAASGVS